MGRLSAVLKVRLEAETLAELERQAAEREQAPSVLARRLVVEGLERRRILREQLEAEERRERTRRGSRR